jgi:hypothetical protein
MVKISLTLRLCILAACFVIGSSSVFAQGGTPVFQPRYAPELKPTPLHYSPPSEPIPRAWIVGGAAVVFLVGCVLVYAASRAWRSANIFERKYHFPPAGAAALRFGGNRGGGLMATIEPADEKKNA